MLFKSSSMRLLQDRSSECKHESESTRIGIKADTVMLPSELADRFMCAIALLPCSPSRKARPPSSLRRFKRRLTLRSESFPLSARPRYLPPCKRCYLVVQVRWNDLRMYLIISKIEICQHISCPKKFR